MIVPMKKVSLIVLEDDKKKTLKALRALGLLHIEISSGNSPKLSKLCEDISLIESSIFAVTSKKSKKTPQKELGFDEALEKAKEISALTQERKLLSGEISTLKAELDRLREWGEIDTEELKSLFEKGVEITLCEMSPSEYKTLDEEVTAVVLSKNKNLVRFAVVGSELGNAKGHTLQLPQMSTLKIRDEIEQKQDRVQKISETLVSYACCISSMKQAVQKLSKDVQFETYSSGMDKTQLSEDSQNSISVCHFVGYIPTEDIDKLKNAATENSWGLLIEDPTEDDDVPTKVKNNKFVSLIYPLTDFLGTVPGYFEYDISGWFLGFILVFFGIIFGDGGYGLLICAISGLLMLKSKLAKKKIQPAFVLVMLLGLATVVWGTLTCTWFGIPAQNLPTFLQKISIPFISNVYADKIWYPPWTNGQFGLTTAQNIQIFCFSLALLQLTVAHIKGFVRNIRSLKLFGDLGSILQLLGIYYIVLSLVVNGKVFNFGLVLYGIPIGTVAIYLIGIGFGLSFIFANYAGSVIKSTLESMKNIVSVLLGVVNVFSDIVSYIRLWAVGLAGAAISSTVNELAGPLMGDLVFIFFAIILLVFGHGLNIILNILSVIVHGVRLNTLEFSTHLDMSWSGHKYKPFEE